MVFFFCLVHESALGGFVLLPEVFDGFVEEADFSVFLDGLVGEAFFCFLLGVGVVTYRQLELSYL